MTSTPHTLARASRQLPLLAVAPRFHITKNAQARNAYGAVAQEIVCAALGLAPIPINGNCTICFDAERDNTFYEIKSVKRGGKVVVYDWRIEKEQAAQVPLFYAILTHGVRGANGHDLVGAFIASELELLVVQAHVVHELALLEPLCTLTKPCASPRAGYNRPGYVRGYRNVPVRRIKEHLTPRPPLACVLYEHTFNVPIFA